MARPEPERPQDRAAEHNRTAPHGRPRSAERKESHWVGDQGSGLVHRSVEMPCPPETAGGFGRFGHTPGAGGRWVPAR